MKNRYTATEHKGDTDVANIDKILVVCSALTNLEEPSVACL